MFWKYILTITVTTGFNVQQMFPTAAAKAPSPLTCIVIQEADGLIYSLSRPPSSSNCETWWELENKTVVARNSKADFKLVQNLTDQFLTLNFCQSYLHYARSCSELNATSSWIPMLIPQPL
ncbi:uncharacterized protein LOC129094341 isoform X2 [Anoplopoma fimbria]|uniref:uncharacterized protein LOC129094341 isoform X2 n=1 Tax=Anoplopoma fimbria TaxID=229290 RepID=UPI0023EC808D|nr:uncharacterized protein LOC129094341 isoform X2 [Anoplopoma fimbria]